MNNKQFFLLGLCILLSMAGTGCTLTNTRSIILRDMAVGALAGALVGQTQSESRDAYTTMYAAIGAAAAGAVSVAINITDENHLKKENQQLRAQIQQIQKQLQPRLVQRGTSLFTSPLPKEVSALVEPGEWKRYKMDQWVQDPNQPNTWYRQVEMFEIIPPQAK